MKENAIIMPVKALPRAVNTQLLNVTFRLVECCLSVTSLFVHVPVVACPDYLSFVTVHASLD